MPVLDGPGAVEAMRDIETRRHRDREDLTPPVHERLDESLPISSSRRAKIFALSGLASKGDKVRAFNAGVDG
jgi:CheY-like chemotaxis protein